MTKMAAMPIYGKTLLNISSGTSWPISMKLGMSQLGLLPIIICSYDDPGMALTYFYHKVKFGNIGFSIG